MPAKDSYKYDKFITHFVLSVIANPNHGKLCRAGTLAEQLDHLVVVRMEALVVMEIVEFERNKMLVNRIGIGF